MGFRKIIIKYFDYFLIMRLYEELVFFNDFYEVLPCEKKNVNIY